DVPTLTFQRSRKIIQRRLGVLAEHGLSRTEADFGLVAGLVLINVADYAFNRGQASVGLGRGLLCLSGLVAGINRMLVGFTGLCRWRYLRRRCLMTTKLVMIGRLSSSSPAVAGQAPAVKVRMRRTTLPLRDFSFSTSSVEPAAPCGLALAPHCTPCAGVIAIWCVLENGARFV